MPAYNFQQRFADLVRRRIKRQTIRARRRDGRLPTIGQDFVGYTGMRTKKCRKLVTGTISEVLPIEIRPDGIQLDGRKLDDAEANTIALLDGFSHANEMVGWFIAQHGRHFVGHLIRWL
jgi:hypothetical protein